MERHFTTTPKVEDNDLSVTAGPGLDLERGSPNEDRQEPESGEHKPGDDSRAKPTLAHLLSLSEQRDRHRALDRVPPSELVAMLDELRASEDQSPQARSLKRVLYDRWAHDQPLSALQHVLAHETNPRLKEQVIHHAFARLAEHDLSEALDAFGGLETRRQREEAIAAMAHHTNLEGLPFLANSLINSTPNAPIEALFRVWAERDPGAEGILELASTGGTRAVHAALEGMAMSDPKSVLPMANQLGPDGLRVALEAISHSDPSLAATAFDELPPGPHRHDLARQIAHRLAREDIQTALAWTDTLEATAKRGAMEEVSREWARQDPKSAAEHALTLSDHHLQREVVSEATHQWARDNPDAALEWANTLEGDTGLAAMRGVIGTIADHDPRAAAGMIDQMDFSTAPADAYTDMTGDLAGHWSRFDPHAAADWAQTLPTEGEAQQHAIERVADHWVEQDTLGASEWMGSLPEGEIRDIAARRLVEHIAPSDPDAAYQWALSMSDPGHQTEMLHEVFEQWQERDPQGAEATLNAAPISNEQRQELGELFE